MMQTMAINRDIMIRNIALIAAFSIFSAMGARSGDVTLAANAVLYNMFLIGGYFLDGFATAAETLAANASAPATSAAFRRAVGLSLSGASASDSPSPQFSFSAAGASSISSPPMPRCAPMPANSWSSRRSRRSLGPRPSRSTGIYTGAHGRRRCAT